MNESVEKLLAQLSSAQLQELLQHAQQKAASGLSSSAQPGTNVRVRITPGGSLNPANRPKMPGPQDEPTVRALAKLSPALRTAFTDAEPKMLAWLRASDEHRNRFLLDPVSALKEAVPTFNEQLLGEIRNLRAASARSVPDVPGLKLDSLKLEVLGAGEKESQ